jgi:hypothetical protein
MEELMVLRNSKNKRATEIDDMNIELFKYTSKI